jgi:hypothetical protein
LGVFAQPREEAASDDKFLLSCITYVLRVKNHRIRAFLHPNRIIPDRILRSLDPQRHQVYRIWHPLASVEAQADSSL